MFDNLIEFLRKANLLQDNKQRSIIIEIDQEELKNNFIDKYANNSKDFGFLGTNFTDEELKNATYTSVISPQGFKIQLKIKE